MECSSSFIVVSLGEDQADEGYRLQLQSSLMGRAPTRLQKPKRHTIVSLAQTQGTRTYKRVCWMTTFGHIDRQDNLRQNRPLEWSRSLRYCTSPRFW